jgi:hypothetical protein
MKLKNLLQIVLNQRNKNHQALAKHFKDAIWILNRLTDSLYEGKVQLGPWQEFFQYQLVKFSFNCSTLVQLSEGSHIQTAVRHQEKTIADIPSIFITTRSLIETYFTIYYLNFESKDEEQNAFRYILYKLNGLRRRQGFDLIIPEAKQKFEAEKKEMEDLQIELKGNNYFTGLSSDDQKELTKGRYAKELNLEGLIQNRGVKNREFLNAWKLFSNHAHSEYIGLIQFKDYLEKPIEVKDAVYTSLTQAMMVTVLLISDLIKNFKAAEIVFNTVDRDVRENIELWIDITKKEK